MVKSDIGDVVNTVERKIDVLAASLGKLAKSMGESAASTAQGAAKRAGTQISDIGEQLHYKSRRAQRSIGRSAAEDPIATVLLAAAFGYGVGYLLHRRR